MRVKRLWKKIVGDYTKTWTDLSWRVALVVLSFVVDVAVVFVVVVEAVEVLDLLLGVFVVIVRLTDSVQMSRRHYSLCFPDAETLSRK